MSISLYLQQTRTAALSLILVVCLFLQPISFDSAQTQTAEAAWATEPTQIANTIENTVTSFFSNINSIANVNNLGIQFSLLNKEFALDGIAFFIAKAALQSITGSLLEWINNGFQGNPAFVQDLKQHLTSIADQELARLVFSPDALDFICSPFRLDVKAALATSFQEGMSQRADYRGPQCGLSDIGENFDNFLAGDFLGGGGMESFFRMTQSPANNTALGAYLSAEAEITARIVNAEGRELNLLSFGDGFLSFKTCDTVDGPDARTSDCAIQTPGKVISEALTFQLSTGAQTLIEADEINEIIGALFYALMNQAIQGAGGLLGLTGADGSPSDYVSTLQSGGASSFDDLQQTSPDAVYGFTDIDRPEVEIEEVPQEDLVITAQFTEADLARLAELIASQNAGAGADAGGVFPDDPVTTDPPVDPTALPPSVDAP